MIRPAIALFLTLAALAPPSEAVAIGGESLQKPAPSVVAPDEEGALPAPPGSPADVALWRSSNAATESIWVERSRATLLQTRLRTSHLAERLEEAAAKAGPNEKEALLALRARLVQAWQDVYQQLARPWPIDPTRGCGYATMAFDSVLRAPAAADRGELAQARGELRECVAKAEGAVRPLAEATRALEAVAAEAERALGSPVKGPVEKGEKKEGEEKHGEPGKGKE